MRKRKDVGRPEFTWVDEAGFWIALGAVLLGSLVPIAAIGQPAMLYLIERLGGLHQTLLMGTLACGALSFGTGILDHGKRKLVFLGLTCSVIQIIGLRGGNECCSKVVVLLLGKEDWNWDMVSDMLAFVLPLIGNAGLLLLYPRNKRARIQAA